MTTKRTAFGTKIKKRLLDIDEPQTWLIERVREKTGLYFDSSYMARVLSGKANSSKIIQAICEILEIEVDM